MHWCGVRGLSINPCGVRQGAAVIRGDDGNVLPTWARLPERGFLDDHSSGLTVAQAVLYGGDVRCGLIERRMTSIRLMHRPDLIWNCGIGASGKAVSRHERRCPRTGATRALWAADLAAGLSLPFVAFIPTTLMKPIEDGLVLC